ncbi:hypothetical protein EJ08DRAFT_302543 [Tothia fuscella]|uniref:Uncharacterized protein n=1 Tax=Tothia fuscella TaxID=1048955 RepID=A0A9P4TXT2_9PEZI|nr:hypothetical protein EJ08DRAFT_302543 [Tothia fuscella]
MASGWAIFFIVVCIVIIAAVGGYFGWRFYQKRNNNNIDAVFPSPAPAGIGAWIQDKFHSLKRGGTRTGAGYEATSFGSGSGARSAPRRGPLDPDEAWDSRVGNEGPEIYGPGGYYEEQELGLHAPNTAYSGAGYAAPSAGFQPAPGLAPGGADRGRSVSPGRNPFGDDAAESLRDVSPRPVSPRPIDTGVTGRGKKEENDQSSPRRSMFRENM